MSTIICCDKCRKPVHKPRDGFNRFNLPVLDKTLDLCNACREELRRCLENWYYAGVMQR